MSYGIMLGAALIDQASFV
jgi:hypothetical protein